MYAWSQREALLTVIVYVNAAPIHIVLMWLICHAVGYYLPLSLVLTGSIVVHQNHLGIHCYCYLGYRMEWNSGIYIYFSDMITMISMCLTICNIQSCLYVMSFQGRLLQIASLVTLSVRHCCLVRAYAYIQNEVGLDF